MSYPGGQPAPGQYPAPQPQFAPPAPHPGGQPQYPGGPQQQQWGAPPPGQPPQQQPGQPGGQPPSGPYAQPGGPHPSGPYAQPGGQHPSGPYAQPGQHPSGPYAQPPAQFGPGGRPGPYGQQPGQPAPNDPPGITVDCSYTPMAFILALTKPKILVNGQQVPNTRWGTNHIPVGAGDYHVKVTTPWLFDMGPAQAPIQVQPGQAVRYYYRSPAIIFLEGALGPVPQKTPGMVFMYVAWGFAGFALLMSLLLMMISLAAL